MLRIEVIVDLQLTLHQNCRRELRGMPKGIHRLQDFEIKVLQLFMR